MRFSETEARGRPAPKTVDLEPDDFAHEWSERPMTTLVVGMRLVSERDIENARQFAIDRAVRMHPNPGDDRIDCYNDSLMAAIVGRALCQHDDASQAFFGMPEDDAAQALTPEGIRRIFHAYDAMKIELAPGAPEADDEELMELSSLLLSDEAWGQLPVAKAKRLRRFCREVLDELSPEIRE